ncbi:transcription termination/antitermination protein NusA [Candidatus Kaiserbacteria bacterium CG10_big_fil_rev_8_21_14_0_10_45_20]|uniref:Transcription termination/antitermination protein NusA n=1 Tax=Candidatus Kaiserbacteria bacterium CG10_big_fil_rev_8_21_14_0_10_45_20 TaxID=1974607 RepID=A0A2H0UFF3_9BACT|nr:MAG: transcription termination/antitermination protein NusA [Candidatus Kaiserbacteria bacterium CG10_big_fil_rev_8_21_14_0_10_45_20]
MTFDLKGIHVVIEQLAEERGIPKEKMLEAVEGALATAYKKEFGKRGQIVRAEFDPVSGNVEFSQVKVVVTPESVRIPETDENGEIIVVESDDERPFYNEEQHMFLEDAKRIKRDVSVDDEIVFPLEKRTDFGRIAAQTAKQVIMQKIREAERASVVQEFGGKEGDIVSGVVQRMERGNLYVDLGRATGIMPYQEQIPGERFRPGERIRAYLFSVEEGQRGVFLRLSRAHPKFLEKLFEMEVPELGAETIVIKGVVREPGSRSKIAVQSVDDRIDPVGALVGQRGVRVSTVTSELGGERIDIIEWSESPAEFVEDALSPAEILSVTLEEDERRAIVEVTDDQQSLAIGRGGQNVRLAAKLTGWSIDIHSTQGEELAETDGNTVSVAPIEEVPATEETEKVSEPQTLSEAPKEEVTEEAAAPETDSPTDTSSEKDSA